MAKISPFQLIWKRHCFVLILSGLLVGNGAHGWQVTPVSTLDVDITVCRDSSCPQVSCCAFECKGVFPSGCFYDFLCLRLSVARCPSQGVWETGLWAPDTGAGAQAHSNALRGYLWSSSIAARCPHLGISRHHSSPGAVHSLSPALVKDSSANGEKSLQTPRNALRCATPVHRNSQEGVKSSWALGPGSAQWASQSCGQLCLLTGSRVNECSPATHSTHHQRHHLPWAQLPSPAPSGNEHAHLPTQAVRSRRTTGAAPTSRMHPLAADFPDRLHCHGAGHGAQSTVRWFPRSTDCAETGSPGARLG